MRTTIAIDDALLKEAKKAAAESGASLASVIEDALRESLRRRRSSPRRRRVRLTTFGGRGLQPGVDLDDTAALQDLMDADNAPG